MADTKIIITFSNGRVDVNGPLHDKILCYGMLEFAKQLIKDYKHSNIVQPSNGQAVLKKINDDLKQQ